VKKELIKLREAFIRIKLYFTRTSSYVSMLNTTMILFLLLSNLEKYGIDIELQKWMIPIIIFWVCFMIFFGWLEDKMGFYRTEKAAQESRSPYWNKLFKRLDKIEERIGRLEKKK